MSVSLSEVRFQGLKVAGVHKTPAPPSQSLTQRFAGNQQPWDAPIVWGTIAGGLALVVVFVLIETYVAKEPLLAPRILFSRTPGAISLACWFASMAQFAIIYRAARSCQTKALKLTTLAEIPLYFSAVEQTTTSYAGLHLIPNAVFASTASLLSGIYMQKTGNYRVMLLIMGALGVVGPFTMIVSRLLTMSESLANLVRSFGTATRLRTQCTGWT